MVIGFCYHGKTFFVFKRYSDYVGSVPPAISSSTCYHAIGDVKVNILIYLTLDCRRITTVVAKLSHFKKNLIHSLKYYE